MNRVFRRYIEGLAITILIMLGVVVVFYVGKFGAMLGEWVIDSEWGKPLGLIGALFLVIGPILYVVTAEDPTPPEPPADRDG